MLKRSIDRLKRINPWHFIWISVVSSELITFLLSYWQGRVWWGGASRETLLIGAVDALVVPLIVSTGAIYFVKQIAELQKSNEQLQEANRKLRAIDRMKTDFLSVVSHEIRTPLTTVKAFVELIIMKPGMPEQRKEKLISTINIETDRLTRMVSELLDLARIESGSATLRMEEVCVEDIVSHSLASLGPLFEGKNQTLSADLGRDHTVLFGDRDRLIQVVTNLLTNAAKYSPAGGRVHVAVRRVSEAAEYVAVEISDTGFGIAQEDLELIFEKYRRSGDTLTDTIDGTGLGLAIAREIVDQHGGRIWATSTRGKGSTFTFTLPVVTDRAGKSVSAAVLSTEKVRPQDYV